MKTTTKISVLIFLTMAFMSCSRLDLAGIFDGTSPHHDARFKHSMEWNKTFCEENGLEEDCLASIRLADDPRFANGNDNYQIYWATDVHVAGTTNLLDSFVYMALKDDIYTDDILETEYHSNNVAAVVFAGDIIDGKNNYDLFYAAVQPVKDAGIPMFCTPGNHDLCFGQWDKYEPYWHTSCYWFEIITPSGYKDLYISCDSGDATFGKKQFDWLKRLLKKKSTEGYRHIIFFTHTHMFKRDSNNAHGANFPQEEVYDMTALLSKYHVEYYINGHDHTHEETTFKNVKYYTIGAMKDSYMGKAAYMTMYVFHNQTQSFIDVTLRRMDGQEFQYWDEEWED